MIYLVILFGVTVEVLRLQSGKTLIPVSHFTIICLATLMSLYFSDNYTKLCTIEADLSRVPLLPRPKATGQGNFYRVKYDIILLFGVTELNAQMAWKENVSDFHVVPSESNRYRINVTRGFLGRRETVSFKKEIVSVELP
jgi:hypothetical protein